jgi:hypothetical protein
MGAGLSIRGVPAIDIATTSRRSAINMCFDITSQKALNTFGGANALEHSADMIEVSMLRQLRSVVPGLALIRT